FQRIVCKPLQADGWRGVLYPCWHVSFNITITPCFFHWSGNTVADKKRAAVFHPRVTYSFQIYLAYALYPALYIARPIITFNDFMWQLTHPKVITPLETVLYSGMSPAHRVHGWLLEPHLHLAQAAPSLALLSSVGSGGWNGPTGKHGTLHGKQLSTPRLLAPIVSIL
ncbi:hypothetical protein BGW80DRAFT_1541115, partial [Lactifluus volemus]